MSTTTDWTVRAITRATLPVLVVLTVAEVGSGLVLGAFEDALLRSPALLVLVPVVIGTAGNLGSVLASRLSTALHLGLLEFTAGDERLVGAAVATVALAATVFPLVGVGAWGVAELAGGARLSLGVVVRIAVVAGSALAVLTIVVAVTTTYVAYRLGLDPDDVVIPVVTNTCDVLGVLVLFATVLLTR